MSSAIAAVLWLSLIGFAGETESEVVTQDTSSAIIPHRMYNPVGNPVMITVTSPRSVGKVTLALLDAQGRAVTQPVDVRPGRLNLGEILPIIFDIRRACYLQVLDHDQPVGSAWVLQPLLDPIVPRTVVMPSHTTTGNPYTKIVGWSGSIQFQPPVPPVLQESNAETDPGEQTTEQPQQKTIDELLSESYFTGLRIFQEQDVVLHTSLGDIRVALRPDEAPNTAWNFLELARDGFFDGVTFHRVVKYDRQGRLFVIQGGDPTGSGDGGPGYSIAFEPSQLPHDFGVISMARADHPDSAGSQFFFGLSREGTARLDGQYCAFGYAVSGDGDMGADGGRTIMRIADVEMADVARGKPVDPPMIERAELVPAPPRMPGVSRPDKKVTPEVEIKPSTQPTRVPR